MSKLPEDSISIPFSDVEKQPEIPPRPGIQGIEISGPEIKAKRFEIDLARSGLESLDWKQLMAVDPHAQIIVIGTVNAQGQLLFAVRDIRSEGHPQAGVIIAKALKTWVYTPFKSGSIEFTFNLPSEGKKLVIDASRLRRRSTVPAEVPILDGPLFYIEGLDSQEIRQIQSQE
ncbi:MAG TPA: hypothetical protein VGB38_01260 [bacterium]